MTTDISPLQRPQDLIDADAYRAWLRDGAGTLPWSSDPWGMTPIAAIGGDGLPVPCGGGNTVHAIIFGAHDDPDIVRVDNWVQVDDLCGMGVLLCGSFGGKFYLQAVAGDSGGSEGGGGESGGSGESTGGGGGTDAPAIAPAQSGEEKGMATVAETSALGSIEGRQGSPLLPRQACPMSKREQLLTVGGKWRSDLPWDTLINGSLSYMPPIDEYHNYTPPYGTTKGSGLTTPYRLFTLRLVQVGQWLCFHSAVTDIEAEAIYDSTGLFQRFHFGDGQRHAIGYSPYDGHPYADSEPGANNNSHPWHGWSAEPPWGNDIANSWQGDSDNAQPAPSPTPAEAGAYPTADISPSGLYGSGRSFSHTYCRIYPRLHISEGHMSPYLDACRQNIDTRPNQVADAIASRADELLCEQWHGGSPDWMEGYLGIDIPLHWEARDEESTPYEPPELTIETYANLQPQVDSTKVFAAHLPMPDGGHVYLSLHTATVDNCLITASICVPYNYWTTA